MLNHFRTLLLNQSHKEGSLEYIPIGFNTITFPRELQRIHDILFPAATSRYFKQFLAHNYLNIVKAAGLTEELIKYDERVAYGVTDDYFNVYRHTNPKTSHTAHPLFVFGKYRTINLNEYFYESFTISQVTNTLKVVVYSNTRRLYINGFNTYPTAEAAAEILLDFTDANGVSKTVEIGDTGISFAISGAADTFVSSAGKTWEFIVEAPFEFHFDKIYNQLRTSTITAALFKFKPEIDVTKYENMWLSHPSSVYKVAALLCAFVEKANSL